MEQIKEILLSLINRNKVRVACEVIACLKGVERKEVGQFINELFQDSEINSSTIKVHLDRVEGYEGNGLPTVNDEDYNERFIKIYFSYDNTCWYCNEDITNADAFFCEEFDTNIHHDCLLKEMKRTIDSKNFNDELYYIVKEWNSKFFKSNS